MALLFVPASSDYDALSVPRLAVRTMPRSWSWTYAAHATIEGKQKRQAIARDAEELAVGLHFHAEWMLVAESIEALRVLAEAFQVVSLQSSDGALYGDYVIEQVQVDPTFVLGDTIVSASVSVQLAEPGVDAVFFLGVRSTPTAVEGSAVDTTDTPKSDNPSGSPETVTPQQITRL